MIDSATMRMMNPEFLSNPMNILLMQQMFQSHGGQHDSGRMAGMSPTFGKNIDPANRMQGLQLKLDAFQDRFTANGARLTQTTQRLIEGVRWWNSLTNNVPKARPQAPPEDDDEPSERADVSVRPPDPPPRLGGPNYPGPDTWTRPPMPGGGGNSSWGGPSMPSLPSLGGSSMAIPMQQRSSGGPWSRSNDEADSSDTDPDPRDQLEAMRKLTDAINKLIDTLSGKGGGQRQSGPGRSFMRGSGTRPQISHVQTPENGNLVEPHL